MQENRVQQNYQDEIDLKELFITIWEKKIFIVVFTAIITILSIVYVSIKTPIYEASALVEIGEYKLDNNTVNSVDNVNNLEKKLRTLYIDMLKNIQDRSSEITSVNVIKGLNNLLEIKSEAISNEKAEEEILKLLTFVQEEHSKILEDNKKQKELELKNIDLNISDINSKSLPLIDSKINNNQKTLENLESLLALLDDNLIKIDTLNPSLAALKLMEKKDTLTAINDLTSHNLELEEKKDELFTNLYKLEENKKIIELLLLPHNYKNTQIVGDIMTNDFPVKPKKSLVVAVAFVTGFILSIFLVFFIQFVRTLKEEIKQ